VGVGRPDGAGVEHAGALQVVDIDEGAPHHVAKAARWRSRKRAALGQRDRWRIGIDRQVRVEGCGEIGQLQAAVRGAVHDQPVADLQAGAPGAEALGGGQQEMVAQAGRRRPERCAGLLDGVAARGDTLVRGATGADRGDADVAGRETKLLGDDTGECCGDALADIDLAAAEHDAAVADRQPVADQRVGGQTHGQRSASAASTARSTLGCEPQRQRCGVRAVQMASRPGLEGPLSSAVTATTSPGVQ